MKNELIRKVRRRISIFKHRFVPTFTWFLPCDNSLLTIILHFTINTINKTITKIILFDEKQRKSHF